MIISYCIALIILLFYCGTGYFILEWIRRFTYWMRHGLLHETPNLFFGSIGGMGTTHFSGETTKKSYDRFVGRDVIAGIHFFMRPVVLILDPELIKNIMVKDFSNFINRGLYSNERDDPLSAHLFSLEDKKWRKLRSKMSPTFTTGKMKYMFDIVLQLAESMATYLEKAAETGCDVEFRDMFARYGTDVIAYCAFGIDCDSINNPETEFRQRSKKIFEPGVLLKLMLLLSVSFPSFSRLVRLKITDKKISKFFLEVVKQNIAYRQEKNIRRNDFFQILMDMGETNTNLKSKDVLSVNQIAAQAFIFFVGGFETSSTTLSFCLYELGKNHEIQDRLRNEIEQVIEKYGGITYDAIQNMTYMDQVINETLRCYPSLDGVPRVAEKDYKIPNSEHTIPAGTLIIIPIFSIHRDERYYPDPLKFDPDRFTEENIRQRHPFTFIPFGEGQRNCIGMRFALMQIRLGLVAVLRKFRVSHSKKTPKIIEFVPSAQTPVLKGGDWLKLEKL